jgi:DNA-binding CsgD family transcriptional regulator
MSSVTRTSRRDYIAIIGDMVNSRDFTRAQRARIQIRFTGLVEKFNHRFQSSLRSQFVVTLGDEFQGLMKDPSVITDIIWDLEQRRELPQFRVGIGFGQIDTKIPDKAINLDGPAFHNARAAIELAKAQGLLGGVFLGFGDKIDVIANGTARLLRFQVDRCTDKQLEIMGYLRKGATQIEIASKLRIKPQAVSQHKEAAGWEAFKAGEEALRQSLCLGAAKAAK